MREGQITQARGGLYTVTGDEGQVFILRAKNKFRRENLTPLVGDEVFFTPGDGDQHGWLEAVKPRRSVSIRPPVANLTQLLITLAPEPVPDLLLVDKLLLFAFKQDVRPLILLNKCDLNEQLSSDLEQAYKAAGVTVLAVSALTGHGMPGLQAIMSGQLNCFAGQSGVGKSTLVSKITGIELETGEVSRKIRRGKQTTRHISLITSDSYQVLDTPGFSLLELPEEIAPESLRDLYPEFSGLQPGCRFEVCLHDREPDCAVADAAQSNRIDRGRLDRYRQLLKIQQEKWSRRYV